MKRYPAFRIVLLIVVLTVFNLGLGVYTRRLLLKDSDTLQAKIDTSVKYLDAGNWNGAENSLDELAKIWLHVKGIWSALIDHQEIDNIDVTLSQLQTLAKSKELPDTLSEAAALKIYIGHIPEKEKLKLENLF